jgi:hypothetical protein
MKTEDVDKNWKMEKEKLSRRWLSSGLLRPLVWYKFTDVSEVLTAFIITVP